MSWTRRAASDIPQFDLVSRVVWPVRPNVGRLVHCTSVRCPRGRGGCSKVKTIVKRPVSRRVFLSREFSKSMWKKLRVLRPHVQNTNEIRKYLPVGGMAVCMSRHVPQITAVPTPYLTRFMGTCQSLWKSCWAIHSRQHRW